MNLRLLSLLESRVLAVLVEKQATVPDSYPLSLNALVLGCNQKTARDPVIAASDAEVLAALDGLQALSLVNTVSGSRVSRYEHNLPRVLGLRSQSVAILVTLVLRGPQTTAELRAHTERLHRFADIGSVEGFLEELAQRPLEQGGPLVVCLPRAPGSREARWAHLLGGAPQLTVVDARADDLDDAVPLGELSALKSNQARLQAEVETLRAQVARLAAELGVDLG